MRTVQKNTWATISMMHKGFLDVLVSGENSVAKALENSVSGAFCSNLRPSRVFVRPRLGFHVCFGTVLLLEDSWYLVITRN